MNELELDSAVTQLVAAMARDKATDQEIIASIEDLLDRVGPGRLVPATAGAAVGLLQLLAHVQGRPLADVVDHWVSATNLLRLNDDMEGGVE